MIKRFLGVFIILFCAMFCCNYIYGVQYTYECKSAKRSDTFTVYEDGKYYTSIDIVDFDLKDIGIETKGNLNERVIDALKEAIIDVYIGELDELLYETQSNKKMLMDYLPDNGNKPTSHVSGGSILGGSDTFIEEEYLAYNCNSLKNTLIISKSSHSTPKFDEVSIPYSRDEVVPLVSVVSKFGDAVVDKLKSEYENIKNRWQGSASNGALSKCSNLYTVYAQESQSNDDQQSNEKVGATGTGNWWNDARDFFNDASTSGAGTGSAGDLVANLTDMIFFIGNMIFIIVTSILGVKYIFGAAEGKAQIKESLMTLIVAALFFYGWSAISNLLNLGQVFTADSYQSAATQIYNTVLFIINLLAICGIIWIGVKYMMSSADGKANIKTNWVPVIVGIIMVYATIWFLTTIIKVVFN